MKSRAAAPLSATARVVRAAARAAGGGGDAELPPNALSIKPINEYMLYDGTSVLRPSGTVQGIADLLAQGYTYSAVVSGEQKSVGFGESKIESFVLYDPNGMDVTNQYDITYGKGRLQVYLPRSSP